MRAVRVVHGLATLVILLIAGCTSGNASHGALPMTATPRAPEQSAAPTATPFTAAPTATPFNLSAWKRGVTPTKEMITAALYASERLPQTLTPGNIISIDLQRDVGSSGWGIGIDYTVSAQSTGSQYMTIGAHTAYSAMSVLFSNPDVEVVQVSLMTRCVDRYGHESSCSPTNLFLQRKTQKQFDWLGLRQLVASDFSALYCIVDSYNVLDSLHDRPHCN